MKRAAAYVRCSTLMQDTDLQKREIESFARARGWHLEVYEDLGFSGSTDKRPRLQTLIHDAKMRKIDVVVVWKLDRFFRSLKHLVFTLQEFSDLGIEFVSLRDNIDLTTSSGRLLVHILSAFSEFEVSIIRERVRAGLSAARARGKTLGRPRRCEASEVETLIRQGLKPRVIAQKLGVSLATIRRRLRPQ